MNKDGDWIQWIAYTVVTMGTMLFVSGIGAGMNTPADELLLADTGNQVALNSQVENQVPFKEEISTKMLLDSNEH
jgi:hypothetical protein